MPHQALDLYFLKLIYSYKGRGVNRGVEGSPIKSAPQSPTLSDFMISAEMYESGVLTGIVATITKIARVTTLLGL